MSDTPAPRDGMPSPLETVFPINLASPDEPVIRRQLDRILSSRQFANCHRLSRFVRFAVEQTLAGHRHRLKEYTIAIEVFDKPETFDPRMDSAVRVAARAMRARLNAYYWTEGFRDETFIHFSAGEYVPHFSIRPPSDPQDAASSVLKVVIACTDAMAGKMIAREVRALGHEIAALAESGDGAVAVLTALDSALLCVHADLPGAVTVMQYARLRPHVAIVCIAPTRLERVSIEAIASANPHSVIFAPIRSSDLALAVNLAITRERRERGIAGSSD